jgi:hypothetical protein
MNHITTIYSALRSSWAQLDPEAKAFILLAYSLIAIVLALRGEL